MKRMVFADRAEAGQLLADAIERRHFSNPVVLALPRGGVPVAVEVARRLHAPLDLVLVRKIGCPFQPELAVGAIVDGSSPEIVTNDAILRETGTSSDYVCEEAQRQLEVIEARRKMWLAGRERVPIQGTTAIVVDDGIATGATMQAALRALRRQGPSRLVVAAPVAPPGIAGSLGGVADEVICLETPEPFFAIGFFYRDFSQVGDDQVTEILERHLGDGREPRTAAKP